MTSSIERLSPPAQRVAQLIEDVYGRCTSVSTWRPRPFKASPAPSRYLWSDAFGVCNLLSLHYASQQQDAEATSKEEGAAKGPTSSIWIDMADVLIDDVHNTLGRNRSLTRRLGSASDEHPLLGGLRIGKAREEYEEDGDGQYFHYLTKWMFALNRMSVARQDEKYNKWAIELAQSVHPHFVFATNEARPHMAWKLSIDLSHPLVPSEGKLDPIDGLAIYQLLLERSSNKMVLQSEIHDMSRMVSFRLENLYFASEDPLDLGEALWLTSLMPNEAWASVVREKSLQGAESMFSSGQYFKRPRLFRLMFREMGFTLGIQSIPTLYDQNVWKNRVEKLHQEWMEHIFERDRDISPLMYASSILPGVFILHAPPKST